MLSGNRSVNEGSGAFLYCKAVAYPTPVKYIWFKNRKPIISDPNGDLVIDTLEDGRSRLTVKQIKSGNHSAEHYYSCSGTNRMGTRQKSFTIYVNCKMRFLIFLLLYNWQCFVCVALLGNCFTPLFKGWSIYHKFPHFSFFFVLVKIFVTFISKYHTRILITSQSQTGFTKF